jgi:predicted RNase H-like HicB family nuclease
LKTGYAVIYFPDCDGWGAEVPDLPGCVTCGATLDEVRVRIKEAIQGWIEVAQEDGDPIPEPSRIIETMNLEIPA